MRSGVFNRVDEPALQSVRSSTLPKHHARQSGLAQRDCTANTNRVIADLCASAISRSRQHLLAWICARRSLPCWARRPIPSTPPSRTPSHGWVRNGAVNRRPRRTLAHHRRHQRHWRAWPYVSRTVVVTRQGSAAMGCCASVAASGRLTLANVMRPGGGGGGGGGGAGRGEVGGTSPRPTDEAITPPERSWTAGCTRIAG